MDNTLLLPESLTMTDNMIEVGKTWDSVADGRMAVEEWAVANGRSYQVLKSTKKQWIAGCRDAECAFGIRITFSTALNVATLVVSVPHTCPAANHGGWRGGRPGMIRWSNEDTRKIVDWLSERDEQGVSRNLDEWNKGKKELAAQRMLKATGLISKAGVNKAKALSKITGTGVIGVNQRKTSNRITEMLRCFNRMRTEAKNAGWGKDPIDHQLPLIEEDYGGISIGEHILSKCWWYYDFDVLFGDSPTVESPGFGKSAASDREAGFEDPLVIGSGEGAGKHEPEGFDADFWHEADGGEDRQGSDAEAQDGQELDLDSDFATVCLNEALAKISSQHASVTNTPEKLTRSLSRRRAQRSTRDLTTRPPSSRTQPQAISSWGDTRAIIPKKPTPKKRLHDDSPSEREADVGTKKRRGQKGEDADRSLEERRLEAEIRQQDRQHQLLMGKQEEVNLRLKLELEKLKTSPRWGT